MYRNLSVLKDEGVVREIYGSDRRAHYDAVTTRHAHFICLECGAIGDVHNLPELDWRAAKELVGCEVTEQRIEFVGVCPACQPRSKDLS